MQDLLVDQIITIHEAIIARDGGDGRLLSEGNLYQVVFQANLMADTIPRAAFTLYYFAAYPAFREGNRRVARELAAQILASGGYDIDPADETQIDQMWEGVLSFTTELQDIETWLTTHARKQS
jgi:prophage maintenance system killer protein